MMRRYVNAVYFEQCFVDSSMQMRNLLHNLGPDTKFELPTPRY